MNSLTVACRGYSVHTKKTLKLTDRRKVPWSEDYLESHVRQLNTPRAASEKLGTFSL